MPRTTETIITERHFDSATGKMLIKETKEVNVLKKVPNKVETKVRKPFQVLFLIDVSGSMQQDTRFREAIAGVRAVLNEMNVEEDWVGIATFSSRTASTAFMEFMDFKPLKSKKSEVEKFITQLETKAKFGSATALYDAMLECTDKFKTYDSLPDLQHLLIVATDGADNDSLNKDTTSINALLHGKQYEKKLNLHVTVLPIEVDESNIKDLETVLKGQVSLPGGIQRRKLGEIHHCTSTAVIRDTFTTAARTVFSTVMVSRTEERTTSVSVDKKKKGN